MTALRGQVAIVTGGAQGIGRAVATRLRTDGARIAIWDMDADALARTARDLDAFAVPCDIADFGSVARALAETEVALGPLSIVVNSAGIAGPNAPIEDYPGEDWRRIVDVNLTGTFHVLKAVIPGMKARNYGRFAAIASIAGKDGNPNASAYSASKAGVIALVKSAGKELAAHNIAVNCVTPAAARTRIFDQMSEEHIAYMLSKIPRGRFLDLDEAAAMIAFMVSPENAFTTGAVFDLSGGRATY